MATLEERFSWLKEVLDESPARFADYYKEDIANYLDIESIGTASLEELLNNKFEDFNECKNKDDVREFIDLTTGYIVMKAQIEEIVADYFS